MFQKAVVIQAQNNVKCISQFFTSKLLTQISVTLRKAHIPEQDKNTMPITVH